MGCRFSMKTKRGLPNAYQPNEVQRTGRGRLHLYQPPVYQHENPAHGMRWFGGLSYEAGIRRFQTSWQELMMMVRGVAPDGKMNKKRWKNLQNNKNYLAFIYLSNLYLAHYRYKKKGEMTVE